MAKNYCYWNGRMTTVDKIKISPYDIGVLRGYGVFDVMAAFNGKPFLFDAHYKRLVKYAKDVKIEFPLKADEYKNIVETLIQKNGYKNSTIRTILTGGVSKDAFSTGKPTFFILIEKFHSLPKELYEKGGKLVSIEFCRHFPKTKVTNYVEAIRNQDIKKKKGAMEILYVNNGNVLEASTSNVFIWNGKTLITPEEGVLLGTTRNLVIDLAKKNGVPVGERAITLNELLNAQEVFLTATNKNIVPIVNVDGKKIGNGKVGEKTKELMGVLENFIKNY